MGRWYSLVELENRVYGTKGTPVFGPRAVCETLQGKRYSAFLLSPPQIFSTREFVLILTCEEMDRLDKGKQSSLTFIGGFDDPDVINDLSKDTSFLALSYPASNYEDMVQRIGSIDFVR